MKNGKWNLMLTTGSHLYRGSKLISYPFQYTNPNSVQWFNQYSMHIQHLMLDSIFNEPFNVQWGIQSSMNHFMLNTYSTDIRTGDLQTKHLALACHFVNSQFVVQCFWRDYFCNELQLITLSSFSATRVAKNCRFTFANSSPRRTKFQIPSRVLENLRSL